MIDSDSIEDHCPICYESFKENCLVSFETCRHKFCKTCATELIFLEPMKCPLDNGICKDVIITNKNNGDIRKTIAEYQFDVVKEDPEILNDNIERSWQNCLPACSNVSKLLGGFLQISKGIFENWLRHDSCISNAEIIDYRNRFADIQCTRSQLYREMPMRTNSVGILNTIRRMFPKENCKFLIKIQEHISNMENLFHLFTFYWTNDNVTYLNDPLIDQRKYLQSMLENIEGDIASIGAISQRITARMILSLNDNRQIYAIDKPNMVGNDVDKCLICSGIIEMSSVWVTFPDCDHKICLQCIEKFHPNEGSCPFHGTKLTKLIIGNEKNHISERRKESFLGYLEFDRQVMDCCRVENIITIDMKLVSEVSDIIRSCEGIIGDIHVLFGKTSYVTTGQLLEKFRKVLRIIHNNKLNYNFELSNLEMMIDTDSWNSQTANECHIIRELEDVQSKCEYFLMSFISMKSELLNISIEKNLHPEEHHLNFFNNQSISLDSLSNNIVDLKRYRYEYDSKTLGKLIEAIEELDFMNRSILRN